MKYRPEIDGLRAIAVLPVILFHAGVGGFKGGFVGVDIFFVISGYLITTILLMELNRDSFSILRFYERRARRILPALFFVMLMCVPFAWLWMLPSQLEDFGQSIVAVSLFVSNILFWRQSGYFDAAAELKPLLHTWSLAVEEQYYIFFPVALFAIWRMSPKLVFSAILLSITVSLGLTEWASRHAPIAGFYLAPTRFWEILIGSLCAWLMWHRPTQPSDLGGLIGLALIFGAIFTFDATTPTPSLWTLMPIVGTALIIIFAVAGTRTARALSFAPMVWVGMLSYSAYLWHQPLLAFARLRLVSEPQGVIIVGLVAATFALAWLSWRFVEQPFRRQSPAGPSRGQIFTWSILGLTAFMVGGILLWQSDGMPLRTAPSGLAYTEIAKVEHMLRPNKGLAETCDAGHFTVTASCSTGPDPQILIWGDSFAMHLAPALVASPTRSDLAQHTLSACGPFPGLAVDRPVTPWRNCMAFNDNVLAWLQHQPNISTVVLSSAFQHFVHPVFQRNGSALKDPVLIEDALERSLLDLAHRIRAMGKRVVFVSPPPRTGNDFGQCFLRRYFLGLEDASCDFGIGDLDGQSRAVTRFLERIESEIPVIWLNQWICNAGTCYTTLDGISLYRDSGHLSVPGSAALGRHYDLMRNVLVSAQ